MGNIRELLELDQWPDLETGPNGFIAKRRLDIAPRAFDISIGGPMPIDIRQRLGEFSKGANPEMVELLFSMCNGLKIGFGENQFAIYGIPLALAEGGPKTCVHLPWDITIPNFDERTDSWPDESLIVGVSSEQGETETMTLFHSIEAKLNIRVTLADDFSDVQREYQSIETWLKAEVGRVLIN